MKKRRPNKLFFKYFLLFAVNLIFFILILSYIIYFVFVQSFVSGQLFRANESTLGEVRMAAEGYLKRADDVAKYFSITNKELLSYQYKDVVYSSALVDFLDRQKKQLLLNDYIFSVYAYYPDKNLIMDLSKTGLYTPKSPDNAKGDHQRFYDNGWIAAAGSEAYNNNGFILLDTRKVLDADLVNSKIPGTTYVNNINAITMIRALDNKTESPRGFVVVNLDERIMSSYFSTVSENAVRKVFIVNSAGIVVSHPDVSLLGKDISGGGYVQRILAAPDPSGHFQARIDGVDSEVVYLKSDNVGWYYVMTTPMSYITQDLSYLNKVILLIVGLILASAVVSIFLMTRTIYSPIETIFEKIKGISSAEKVAMVKSEVKTVDSLLDSIKQNYDHLGKLVFDNYYLLKYDFLNRLVNGECSAEQAEAGLREYKIRFDHGNFLVICVAIDSYESIIKQYNLKELYMLNQAVIRIVEETFSEKYYAVGSGSNRNSMAFIVNAAGEFGKSDLAGIMRSSFELIRKYLNISVSAGVGNGQASRDQLKLSFEQANEALRNRLNVGGNSLVFYDEISREEGDLIKPSAFEEQIIDAVKAGQKDKCLQALDGMIVKIREKNLSRRKVENIFTELVLILNKQLNYQNKSFEDICGHTFPEMLGFITSVETLDGLRDYLSEALGALSEHFSSSRKNHNEELVAKVIRYIETHYSEDLSLEGISASLKLTPQYVRKLVKDITGLNLLDYLTDIRIKRASEMLMKTELSMLEVAEKVGYVCYRTFLQHFRERSGMIPTQFRKSKNRISMEQ